MWIVAEVLVAAAGIATVIGVLGSAITTLILPRAAPGRLNRFALVVTWGVLGVALGRAPSYERRDRFFAFLGPLFLLALAALWMALIWLSFTGFFWDLAGHAPPAGEPFVTSVSSLTTLGFNRPGGTGADLLAGLEAVVGLALLALLISYLPAVYGSFSRREAMVNKLSARAGVPPSGVRLLSWTWRFDRFEDLRGVWTDFEDWFTEIGETHATFPVLAFFRSPRVGHSWITAAGSMLDGASLLCSVVDVPREIEAELSIRAGYLALRTVADTQGITYPEDPAPGDPITLVREEFDDACAELEAAGVPLKADRDEAWRDFSGWRVNYDRVLVTLATNVMAPYARWSSDRSVSRYSRPRLLLLRSRRPPVSDRPWS